MDCNNCTDLNCSICKELHDMRKSEKGRHTRVTKKVFLKDGFIFVEGTKIKQHELDIKHVVEQFLVDNGYAIKMISLEFNIMYCLPDQPCYSEYTVVYLQSINSTYADIPF